MLERYLEHLKTGCRLKTYQCYSSRVTILKEYIASLPMPIQYAYQYDKRLVSEFLDWLVIDRECCPRTANNYLGWCGALGSFMVQRKYIEGNPADGIPKLRENAKKRRALSGDMLRTLFDYLQRTDRLFLLACMMEYYTFIRPTELSNLRLRDFSIREQRVFVSGDFSKNHKGQFVGVNETLIRLMLDLGTFTNPGECYLFSKGFRPGMSKERPDIFNKRWAKLRKVLRWGDEYQFYSLKDSGIRDLANEKGIVIARDQARHSDISTTNIYLGPTVDVREETKSFEGYLSAEKCGKTPP